MSNQSFDAIERLTIWEAYDCICRYCRKPVDFDVLRIDHVIPELISPEDLELMKNRYGLDENFDVSQHYNHVPSCDRCNSVKNARTLSNYATDIAYILDEAKLKAAQIKESIRVQRTGNLFVSLQTRIRAGAKNGNLTIDQWKKLVAYGDGRFTDLISASASSLILTDTPLGSYTMSPTVATTQPFQSINARSGYRKRPTGKHSKGRKMS